MSNVLEPLSLSLSLLFGEDEEERAMAKSLPRCSGREKRPPGELSSAPLRISRVGRLTTCDMSLRPITVLTAAVSLGLSVFACSQKDEGHAPAAAATSAKPAASHAVPTTTDDDINPRLLRRF